MATLNYFTGAEQLQKELVLILEDVIGKVTETLLGDFQKHLLGTVYAAPKGNYHRYFDEGGFYDGWCIHYFDRYTRGLVFKGNKLVAPNEDMFNSQMSHGGSGGRDRRGDMPWILNSIEANDIYSYAGGANYLEGNRGYWDSYLCDIDKKIEEWLDIEFKKYGIGRR